MENEMDGKSRVSVYANLIGMGLLVLVGVILLMKVLMDAVPSHVETKQDAFGHSAAVNALAFSPDSQLLASASDDGTVKLWDSPTRTQRLVFEGHIVRDEGEVGAWSKMPVRVLSVTFSPDGKTLASGDTDGRAKLWMPSSGREQASLKALPDMKYGRAYVASLAITQDATRLAMGVSNSTGEGSPWECRIKLWELLSGNEIRTVNGLITPYPAVAFTPDGVSLAFANGGRKVMLLNVSSGHEQLSLEKPDCTFFMSIAISGDGRILAGGEGRFDSRGKDLPCDVILWELATGKELAKLEGHSKYVSSIAFSPDSNLLASASWDSTVRLWDVSKGKQLAVLSEHEGPVNAVAFSPDGKLLASGGRDGTIHLWEIEKLLLEIPAK